MSLADEWDNTPGGKTTAPAGSLVSQWDDTPAPKDVPRETSQRFIPKIVDAFNRGADAVEREGLAVIPKAVGEVALNAVTSGPLTLLRHGVEEGAYLSGQSPDQAAQIAQRTIPWQGYQPQTEAGKANAELVGDVIEPVVNAGKWVANKLGFSQSFENLAGDFAPAIAPTVINKTGEVIAHPLRTVGRGVDAANNALEGAGDIARLGQDLASQGSLQGAKARFGQLIEQGNAPPSQVTPQMLRGQEPIPENLQVPVDKAPEVTLENASPQLQKSISKADLSPNAVNRYVEADSLPIKMQLTEGQATGDIHKLSDEFNMRAKQPALADVFNRQNSDLISNINAIRDRAAPQTNALDHVENGETLINAYKAKDAGIKSDIDAKYEALREAAGGDFPIDAKGLYQNIQGALKDQLLTHDAPTSQLNSLKELAEEGSMTYEKFLSLRKNLGNIARTAQDGNTRTAAGIMINELESLPLSPEAQALQPLADAARSAAKARFNLLDKDPAYKAAVNDSVPADKFVQKYVVGGNKADLAQMHDFLKDNPTAQQNIAAGALNYLKSRAGIVNDNGNFSQAGYNKALEQLRPKLDYLVDPITAQQIQTLGNVARYTIQQPRGSYFNNSNTFVSAAKELGEGALNAKSGGIYGFAKNTLRNIRETKAAENAVKIGGEVPLKDVNR